MPNLNSDTNMWTGKTRYYTKDGNKVIPLTPAACPLGICVCPILPCPTADKVRAECNHGYRGNVNTGQGRSSRNVTRIKFSITFLTKMCILLHHHTIRTRTFGARRRSGATIAAGTGRTGTISQRARSATVTRGITGAPILIYRTM